MNYETSGQIKDLSGNGNHGTLSPIYPCNCPTLVDSFNKKQGKATEFDGVNDYIDAGNAASLDITGPITIELCLKPILLDTSPHIVTRGTVPTNGYYIQILYTGVIQFSTIRAGVERLTESGAGEIVLGNWQHIVATREGTVGKIYKNGIDVSFTQQSHLDPIPSNNILYIARYTSPVHYLHGTIDELRIYNQTLSPDEISKIYQSYNL